MTGQKRYFWLAVTADEYELPLPKPYREVKWDELRQNV